MEIRCDHARFVDQSGGLIDGDHEPGLRLCPSHVQVIGFVQGLGLELYNESHERLYRRFVYYLL